jgi:hypothetical protein
MSRGMSPNGTNPTNRVGPAISGLGGEPEVAGKGLKRRD